MASRGRGRRRRPWGTGQAPPTIDQTPAFDQGPTLEPYKYAAAKQETQLGGDLKKRSGLLKAPVFLFFFYFLLFSFVFFCFYFRLD